MFVDERDYEIDMKWLEDHLFNPPHGTKRDGWNCYHHCAHAAPVELAATQPEYVDKVEIEQRSVWLCPLCAKRFHAGAAVEWLRPVIETPEMVERTMTQIEALQNQKSNVIN